MCTSTVIPLWFIFPDIREKHVCHVPNIRPTSTTDIRASTGH